MLAQQPSILKFNIWFRADYYEIVFLKRYKLKIENHFCWDRKIKIKIGFQKKWSNFFNVVIKITWDKSDLNQNQKLVISISNHDFIIKWFKIIIVWLGFFLENALLRRMHYNTLYDENVCEMLFFVCKMSFFVRTENNISCRQKITYLADGK